MDMQNLETQFEELKARVDALSNKAVENKLAMVVFSGELDLRMSFHFSAFPFRRRNFDFLYFTGSNDVLLGLA